MGKTSAARFVADFKPRKIALVRLNLEGLLLYLPEAECLSSRSIVEPCYEGVQRHVPRCFPTLEIRITSQKGLVFLCKSYG